MGGDKKRGEETRRTSTNELVFEALKNYKTEKFREFLLSFPTRISAPKSPSFPIIAMHRDRETRPDSFERSDHSCPSFGSLVHHPSFHKTISYSACWVSPHRKKWILADEGQVRVTCKSICFYSVFFITWPSHQKLHILARLSSPSLYDISFWYPPSLFNL